MLKHSAHVVNQLRLKQQHVYRLLQKSQAERFSRDRRSSQFSAAMQAQSQGRMPGFGSQQQHSTAAAAAAAYAQSKVLDAQHKQDSAFESMRNGFAEQKTSASMANGTGAGPEYNEAPSPVSVSSDGFNARCDDDEDEREYPQYFKVSDWSHLNFYAQEIIKCGEAKKQRGQETAQEQVQEQEQDAKAKTMISKSKIPPLDLGVVFRATPEVLAPRIKKKPTTAS